MKFARILGLLTCLSATAAVAEDAPPVDKASVVGSWQGVMVVDAKGKVMVMPATFRFK